MRTTTRQDLAERTKTIGETVNGLRAALIAAEAPFSAGLVRAAEEALLVVYTSLADDNVKDTEL